MTRKVFAFSLFWRTFCLLGVMLAGGIFAWVQTLRALEFEPRAVQEAAQIAGLVNLTRGALMVTGLIELMGAVLLSFRFVPQYGFLKGLTYHLSYLKQSGEFY